jgi:hypothetical protein
MAGFFQVKGMQDQNPTNELSGKITLEFQPGSNLDSFCQKNIPNYDTGRFEAIAVRFFAGKEIIITVYALDKLSSKNQDGLLPVKKFKIEKLNPYHLEEFLLSVNFTASSQKYDLDKMEVINK